MTNDKDRELIERMKAAIEGECNGLAIDDAHAKAIIDYVLGGYLAERGKDTFCFVKVESDGKYGGASPTPFGPCKTPVFLAPLPAIPEGMELMYAFRRKGQDDFCTCSEARYKDFAQKPDLFDVTTFFDLGALP